MAKWAGWLAAVGGLLAILAPYIGGDWAIWVGGIAAIVFGFLATRQ